MSFKKKIVIQVAVSQEENGKPIVHHNIEEENPTMKDVALAVYKLKQIEQEFIDRIWDKGGEGYEIIGKGDEQ